MFNFTEFFREKDPIYSQIDHFLGWKSVRQPFAAQSQHTELVEFVKKMRVKTVTDITLDTISSYQDSLNSDYFRNRIVHVLRQFFGFCQKAGYANMQIKSHKGLLQMEKIHPLLDVGQVLRVKELRAKRMSDGSPMSYRKIKQYMEKQDKRVYDIKNIYKWANYKLPKDFEVIPT